MRACLLTLFMLASAGQASILLDADQELQATCVLYNPAYPGQAVVYDLGLPDSRAAIALRRPTRSDPFLPEALAVGLTFRPETVSLQVILGETPYGTPALPIVAWQETALKPEAFVGTTGLVQVTYSLKSLPDAPGVLWLWAPKAGELVLLSRLEAEPAPQLLTTETTRQLFAKYGPYETRSLAGKSRILCMDLLHGYPSSFAFDVVHPLQPDLRTLGYQESWIPLSEWQEADIVLLHTRHRVTAEESAQILAWVQAGGTLIVTPHTLSWMVVGNAGVADEIARWTGGYSGLWQRIPTGEVTYHLEDGQTFQRGGDMSVFVGPSSAAPEDHVKMTVTAPGGRQLVGIFEHPVGKGLVIGTVKPFNLSLAKWCRNRLVDLQANSKHP